MKGTEVFFCITTGPEIGGKLLLCPLRTGLFLVRQKEDLRNVCFTFPK